MPRINLDSREPFGQVSAGGMRYSNRPAGLRRLSHRQPQPAYATVASQNCRRYQTRVAPHDPISVAPQRFHDPRAAGATRSSSTVVLGCEITSGARARSRAARAARESRGRGGTRRTGRSDPALTSVGRPARGPGSCGHESSSDAGRSPRSTNPARATHALPKRCAG